MEKEKNITDSDKWWEEKRTALLRGLIEHKKSGKKSNFFLDVAEGKTKIKELELTKRERKEFDDIWNKCDCCGSKMKQKAVNGKKILVCPNEPH